ncbi:hypothetical protein ON010_g9968 [Phytophthora cinnamomi]|nr:hypothetical protein ON010_g9968 [Phytophthora cinnamomi]
MRHQAHFKARTNSRGDETKSAHDAAEEHRELVAQRRLHQAGPDRKVQQLAEAIGRVECADVDADLSFVAEDVDDDRHNEREPDGLGDAGDGDDEHVEADAAGPGHDHQEHLRDRRKGQDPLDTELVHQVRQRPRVNVAHDVEQQVRSSASDADSVIVRVLLGGARAASVGVFSRAVVYLKAEELTLVAIIASTPGSVRMPR